MTFLWLALGLLVGAAVSGVITYLIVDRRCRSQSNELQSRAAVADQRAADHAQRIALLEAQVRQADAEKVQLANDRATLVAQLEAERDKLVSQAQFVAQAEQRLKDAFATISAQSLQQGNKQFLDLAAERFNELTKTAAGSLDQKKLEMQNLLQPVQQTLDLYRVELAKLEASRGEAFTTLSVELGKVATTQELLNRETKQLSTALRRSEVRGQWGEMTLRRLLEMSGLAQRVVFHEQVSVDTEDNGRQRPDCVVQLPNDRQVLIDCKAVLDAFLDGINGCDDLTRAECFKRHARQVRAKVDELSRKAYWQAFGGSADYVVLFLPGEAFLYAAVEHDPGLIEDGLKNNVIIASPTTLLGLLKVIEYGWEKKLVEENADKIRDLGTELHKSVGVMAEHFERLGDALAKSVSSYNDTLASMERNLFVKTRKMAELGATSNKTLTDVPPREAHPRELGKQWKALPSGLLDDE